MGDLIEIGFLGGIQTNLKIRRSAPVFRPRSSANKVQPNFLSYIIFMLCITF